MATDEGVLQLRVGIVGLGRLWEVRHRPALARMADRFRVTAVYDQVGHRAAVEAGNLGCAAPQGLAEMIARPDVDAIYLLGPQWFGLHAALLAAEAGKPIYCALPLAADPTGIESLARMIREGGGTFVPELARRFYPATLRLRELLATRLGPPRLIVGHARLFGYDRYGNPGPTTQLAPLPLLVDPGANLLDWCRHIVGSEPSSIEGFGASVLPEPDETATEPDFEGFVLGFPDGATAQVTSSVFHRAAWHSADKFLPRPGFQVFAERGVAWLEMPDRIQWTDSKDTRDEQLPVEPPLGEVLNDHFHRLLRGEQSLSPGIDDALAAVRLVEHLKRSRREGRRIELAATGTGAAG